MPSRLCKEMKSPASAVTLTGEGREKVRQLIIDPEFRDKIPQMTEAEFNQLEENILKDGRVKVPLTVWNDTIVDGHNRYAIIQKHPELKWSVDEVHFEDRYEAVVWICKNQLGRRNLTEEQKSFLRGKQYEAEKMTQGTNNQYVQAKSENGQNVHFHSRREVKDGTAGRIGKEYGVNGRTIRRDADFAKGVDAAEAIEAGAKNAILSGKSKIPKSVIAELPTMEPERQQEVIKTAKAGLPWEKPKSRNPAGYPKEWRELNQTIKAVVDSMYDTDRVVEHTVDDLLEDLGTIISDFAGKAKRSIQNYSTVLQEEGAKEKVIAALSEAEAAIGKVKGLLL